MDKKGVAELKRRFTKENCTFTRLCGCYVDAGKNKVVDLSETFLNLEDEEFYKYLEIAKKTLSGTIGNNLLELNFPLEEEAAGGRQQFLLGLRESKLKNPELLDRFYDMVIESYDYAGNYLILLFHDAYDVMTKTTDNNALDESEEVFEYLLCAICPVQLSKPGLGYREDENRIGPRIRDWVVSVPDSGFLFPAFTDRSTDIHSLMFYTKDTKAPHAEFMELGLGCGARRTATEQKMTFHSIVKQAYGDDVEKSGEVLMEIQQNLNDLVEEKAELEEDPVVLTPELLANVMEESGVAPEKAEKIGKTCAEEFAEEAPLAENVVDSKALAANEQIQKEKELVAQVEVLQQQLKEKQIEEEADEVVKTYDVVLRVKPEKVSQIKSEVINGQKCLVIPMAEDEHANVNGVNTTV
ncbi:DUF4317 domain-containing protein [Thermoguttaceae bacterium LCP21S3_D4]|nr:DUF4317 domain-containing protein [Lachnospiraceae bacterium]HCJ77136.1 hypothetical protein [Roseburia sp.]